MSTACSCLPPSWHVQ